MMGEFSKRYSYSYDFLLLFSNKTFSIYSMQQYLKLFLLILKNKFFKEKRFKFKIVANGKVILTEFGKFSNFIRVTRRRTCMGYLYPCSVQHRFGVIRCNCDFSEYDCQNSTPAVMILFSTKSFGNGSFNSPHKSLLVDILLYNLHNLKKK